MNETDTAVKLENHEQQIRSLKHRMDEQEEQSKSLSSMAVSIEKLVMGLEQVLKGQDKQDERLDKLEDEPVKQYRGIKNTVVNTAVQALMTAVMGGLLLAGAQYIMR